MLRKVTSFLNIYKKNDEETVKIKKMIKKSLELRKGYENRMRIMRKGFEK